MNHTAMAQKAAEAAASAQNGGSHGEPGLVIALMGETGSGKSSFINTVAGHNALLIGDELHSCTNTLMDIQVFIDGRSVRLIDTPGFSDTYLSDTEVLKRIASYMALSYGAGIKLSGIIYLHKLTNDKMVGSAMKNLQMFRKLVGRKGLRNVKLVSTKESQIATKAEAMYRHQQLQDIYWADMIREGSGVALYDGLAESATALVRDIMRNHPIPLKIQEELVDQHKDLLETAAGAELNTELLAERKRKDQELAETKALYEQEQVQLKREREEERQQAKQREKDLQRKHEIARANDKEVLAEMLETQMAKEKEASREREREWRREQEEIREQNAREIQRMQAERDAAERRFEQEQESLRQFREEERIKRANLEAYQGQGMGDAGGSGGGASFFAWSALFLLPMIL